MFRWLSIEFRFVAVACSVLGLLTASSAEAAFTDHGPAVLGANHNSRSASLADIDNDGDLDLFFQGAVGSQQLYRNNLIGGGTLGFTNISADLPGGLGHSWSAAWGDINGDGLVDVFVGQSNIGATGDVLLNLGASGFSNASASTGLDDPGFHQNVGWSDIDNDNDLDLIIGMEGPEKHEIYLQGRRGEFTPVGAAAGIQQEPGIKGYGLAMGDSDGDGDIDLYFSTCRGDNNIRNHFYENQLAQTGSLTFIDIADDNGTQFMQNSYGTEFADFDNDGDLDLQMTGADGQKSKIFRNDGGNQFTDVDTITGHDLLSDTSGDLDGSRVIDYDNDGDLDLFFHDHGPKNGKDAARKLYRNDGNWQFTDVTVAEGLHETSKGSYDSAWGDIDRDGDQDLIATTDSSWNERVFLSDASGNGNHWLYIELEGPTTNTTGLGSTLYATVNAGTPEEKTLRREANTNAGTFNQSDLPVHFGLGDATVIDELRVVWKDGTVQVLAGVAVDQYLTIDIADLLPGDFNGDGLVDAVDYAVWREAEGAVGIGNAADGNGDGAVDSLDFAVWQANYGAVSGPGAGLVPEPTSLAMLLVFLTIGALHWERPGGSLQSVK